MFCVSVKFSKGHFIAGAMDNVDHTLSSTTAVSSFYGTDNYYDSEDTVERQYNNTFRP